MKTLLGFMLALMLTTTTAFSAEKFPTRFKKGSNFTIYKLGQNSYSIKGSRKLFGSNGVFIVTPEGVVVYDAQFDPKGAEIVKREIALITDQPITHLIYSHFHGDHILGATAYDSSVTVIAHKWAKELIALAKSDRRGSDQIENYLAPIRGNPELLRIPDRGINRNTTLFSGKPYEIKILDFDHSHTLGDIGIYFQQDKVLAMGDAYVNGYVGFLGQSMLKPWIARLDRALDLEADVVVPGHGRIQGAEKLLVYRDYLEDFRNDVHAHLEIHGNTNDYELPAEYSKLGARYFLQGNFYRAWELWTNGQL